MSVCEAPPQREILRVASSSSSAAVRYESLDLLVAVCVVLVACVSPRLREATSSTAAGAALLGYVTAAGALLLRSAVGRPLVAFPAGMPARHLRSLRALMSRTSLQTSLAATVAAVTFTCTPGSSWGLAGAGATAVIAAGTLRVAYVGLLLYRATPRRR